MNGRRVLVRHRNYIPMTVRTQEIFIPTHESVVRQYKIFSIESSLVLFNCHNFGDR